jgi:hypothetical protein
MSVVHFLNSGHIVLEKFLHGTVIFKAILAYLDCSKYNFVPAISQATLHVGFCYTPSQCPRAAWGFENFLEDKLLILDFSISIVEFVAYHINVLIFSGKLRTAPNTTGESWAGSFRSTSTHIAKLPGTLKILL